MRLLGLLFCAALCAAPCATAAEKITGGNGTIYFGGRPNNIFILDEATEKVTGSIECKTGTPTGLELSEDRKRFYVHSIAYEDIEIVDIAARKVIDNFRLSEGNKKMRVFGFEPDPLNRYMILLVKPAGLFGRFRERTV